MTTRKVPWTSQPQVPVGIDWSNPIASGLTNFWYPLLLPRPPAQKITAAGIGGTFASNFLTPPFSPISSGNRTMICVAAAPNASIWKTAVCFSSSSLDPCRALAINQTSANKWRVQSANGSAAVEVVSSAAATGRPQVVAAVNNGITLSGFVDGNKIGSVAQNGGLEPTVWSIGGIGTGEFWTGAILLVLQFNRALLDAEIASISANPWQIFAPQSRPIFVGIPGGVSSTSAIAATTGAAVGSLVASSSGNLTTIATGTESAVGDVSSRTTSKVVISAVTGNSLGALATKTTSKVAISSTTANAVGSVGTKTTCKTVISTTTANAVGSVHAGSGVATAIGATTSAAVGNLGTKATAKVLITATTGDSVGGLAGYATSKIVISAALGAVFGAVASTTQVACAIGASTAPAVGAVTAKTTCRTGIATTLSNAVGACSSIGGIPQLSLTQADLDAIAVAVWAHPSALTLQKFLGLK